MTRTPARKIVFGLSLAALACMAASIVLTAYFLFRRGVGDVWSASLFATTVFFASCAIVLYFMSKPPRHELLPWDSQDPDEKHGAL